MKRSFRFTKAISIICTAVLIAGSFPFMSVNASTIVEEQTTDSLVRLSNAESNELKVPAIKENVLEVPDIKANVLKVAKIKENVYTAPNAEIITHQGSTYYEDQKNTYIYTAERDGVCRAELSDIDETGKTISFGIRVKNASGTTIKGTNYGGNGNGVTWESEAGKTYTIEVQQDENLGSYTLSVGKPKPMVNVLDYTIVEDSIEFTDQKNVYSLKAPRDGQYRFELAGIDETGKTINFGIRVKNANGSTIKGTNYGGNGNGCTVMLEEGKGYFIEVEQDENVGSYTLIVGQAKPIQNIVKATKVTDSTQYTDQLNVYSISAPRDGQYRFELAGIDETGKTINFGIRVKNANGSTISGTNYGGNGTGCTVTLAKGKGYTVEVQQEENLGAYTLIVGQPKAVQKLDDYTKVTDSTQYTDQKNVYSITAPRDGQYHFELAGIDETGKTINFGIRVKNANGSTLSGTNYGGNGTKCTLSLTQGSTYTVEVQQEENVGAYTLIVGQQKETQTITSKRFVRDSFQFNEQRNKYMFVPSKDASYRFQIEDLKNDGVSKELFIKVVNADGNTINSTYVKERGQGVTVDLKSGATYFVVINQVDKLFSYTLVVGAPNQEVVPTATPKPTAAPTKKPAKPTTAPKNENTAEIEKFVERIYIYVLDRDPEADGSAYWTKELYDFNRSGAEVAQGFIFSDEFNDRNTSDKEFIEVLYNTFFGREYDDAGMEYWLKQLSSGAMSRPDVANGFIFSQEWADTCAKYGIRSGGTTKPTVSIDPTELTYKFVERMYTTAMKRDYDKDGRDYWAKELSNFNVSGEEVGASFFLSAEMVNFKLSDSEYINRLYLTFMDRESDADGKAYWMQFLKEGHSRLEVVYGFTRSPEFVEKCIEARILPF